MAVEFIVTQAGIREALLAEQKGFKVVIKSFTLGSGYGYEPNEKDKNLHGNILYRGEPSLFRTINDLTKLIVCKLPPEAGPFEYGEIGLWTDTGVLFALCSFEQLNYKYSSIETATANSATFNCILTLKQGASSVTIDFEDNPQNINEIENTSSFVLLNTPREMGYSQIVQELIVSDGYNGRNTVFAADWNNNTWHLISSNYELINNQAQIVSFSSTGVLVSLSTIDSRIVKKDSEFYLLQINRNTWRKASATVLSNGIQFTWIDAISAEIGKVAIYQPNLSTNLIPIDQVVGNIDYNKLINIPKPVSTGVGYVNWFYGKANGTPPNVDGNYWLYVGGSRGARTRTFTSAEFPELCAAMGTSSCSFPLMPPGYSLETASWNNANQYVDASAPEIWGNVIRENQYVSRGSVVSGAFYHSSGPTRPGGVRSGNTDDHYVISMNASRCNNVYGRDNTIKQNGMRLHPFLRIR